MLRLSPILLPVALAAFAPITAAGQEAPPAARARELVGSFAAAEARVTRGRLALVITDRRATVTGPLDAAARARIVEAAGAVGEGTLLFGPEGWLKDLTVPATAATPRAMRVRTAEAGGVLRNLMVVTPAGGAEEAYGRVLRVPLTAPADALLTRRAGPALLAIEWTAARPEGDAWVLDGRRLSERHTLTLAPGASPEAPARLRRWKLERRLTSPEGEAVDQVYEIVVETAADGAPTRVDEWLTAANTPGSVTFRRTAVSKFEETPSLTAADLQLRFPKGTRVVDVRTDVPIEYEQTAEGINDADVAEAARALAQGRTRAGQTAPDFLFRDDKGKLVKLTDLTGNVVVLFWFSTASQPAQQAAPAMQALYEKYRKRRVRVIGLLTGEAGDVGARAEAFRKQFKWAFPVYVDTQGEAMHRFGLIAAVPKIAVVDRTGTLAYAEPGAHLDAVTTLLERLADRP
jgi:peroxiredoxin